ncbi:hypothetical protein ACLMJK_003157 [Lecanora helva]
MSKNSDCPIEIPDPESPAQTLLESFNKTIEDAGIDRLQPREAADDALKDQALVGVQPNSDGKPSKETPDELSTFSPVAGTKEKGTNREDLSSNEPVIKDYKEDHNEGGAPFVVTGFADRGELAHWFPQIYDDESKSWRIWISKRSRALLLHTGIVGVILLTNFILTLWAAAHYPHLHGVSTLYQGSCAFVKRLDLWLHLLINVLSTGMLMASNYCMQLQAAPTRKNVDKAHKAHDWLDIGVPSLRNLRYISNWRRFSWVLLAVSSLPVHLIYNSAVFTSLASNDYTVAVVNDAFLSDGSWNLTAAEVRGSSDPGLSWVTPNNSTYGWRIPVMTPEETIATIQNNASKGLYTKMDANQCFLRYNDYFAALGNVVVVTSNQSVQGQVNDSLLIYASIIPNSDDWAKNQWATANGTKVETAARTQQPKSFPISTWYLGPGYYVADYCLVQPPATTADRCRFEYAPGIMVTICIINLVKVCVMLSVWWARLRNNDYGRISRRFQESSVLYTLGDAVASFMQEPDETTKSMCLATRYDFQRKRDLKFRPHLVKEPSTAPRPWTTQRQFWNSAASWKRWAVLLFFCVLILAVASGLLARSVTTLSTRNISRHISDLWDLGFGALTPFTFIYIGLPRNDPAGLISNVLIANLPQFILSILYIFYNGMISTFLVQREFSKMKSIRKPLRVSEPLGIQRGSYFISLPLRYGIPLYTTSAIMHWLISQSLFLARVTAFFPNGEVDIDSSFSTCGYSPIALFIIFQAILVGICLVLGLVGIGFRQYDPDMPLVASNSRAISAACHVPPEDVSNGHMLPVQWGVVKVDDTGVGHCAFTTAWDVRDKAKAGTDRFA